LLGGAGDLRAGCYAEEPAADAPTVTAEVEIPWEAFALLSDSAVHFEIGLSQAEYAQVLKNIDPKVEHYGEYLNGRRDEFWGLPWDVMQKKRQAILRDYQAKVVLPARRAAAAKMQEVLSPKQQIRLDQIALQEFGPRALLHEAIARRLELTARQQAKIVELTKVWREATAEVRRGVTDDNEDESLAEVNELQQQYEKDLLAVLTPEQLGQWRGMQGPDYMTTRDRLAQLREKAIVSMRPLAAKDAASGWSAPPEHDTAKFRGDLSQRCLNTVVRLPSPEELGLTSEQVALGNVIQDMCHEAQMADVVLKSEYVTMNDVERRQADAEKVGYVALAVAEARNVLMDALSPRQRHRLFQITLQGSGYGPSAALRDEFREWFKITAEQEADLKALKDRHEKEHAELRRSILGDRKEKRRSREDFAKLNEASQTLRDRQDKELFDVLNERQLAQWKELVGPPRMKYRDSKAAKIETEPK
jgi:hypothetical protein